MPLRPHVARITFLDPLRLRLHVAGEVHPGELAARGYTREGGEWVLPLVLTTVTKSESRTETRSQLIMEFQALHGLGYAFREGDEFAPAEMWRNYRSVGAVSGDAVFL